MTMTHILILSPRIRRILGLIAALCVCATSAQAQQPVSRADQFIDFIGLNASPFERYLDSGPYQGAGTKYPPETFFDLGIRHYRTGLKNDLTLPDAPARINAAYAKYGAQPMLLIDPNKDGGPAGVVSLLKQYAPGVVGELEGPNEVNNKFPPQELNLKYGGKTDEAAGAAFMADTYKAVKADPATKNIPVVAYTAIFTDYRLARPYSAFDFANMHSYQGYDVPSSSLLMNETRFNNALPVGGLIKPFVPTECGYNVQADVSNGTGGTGSLRAQALNIPMLLAEYFRHGIRRAYLFALHNADGYGLLESDQQTKRPSYYALQNFVAELKDAAWDAKTRRWVGGDFTPRALLFTLTGAPATIHSLTLQKKDGEYDLLLWNEVKNFDQDAHKDIVNPPVPVTLRFQTPVPATARLLTQNDRGGYNMKAASVAGGVLRLDVPSSVMIVKLRPRPGGKQAPLPAPVTVQGTATENSVHLTWRPSVGSRAVGYFVFRNGEFLTATHGTSYDDLSSWVRPGLGYTYAVQSYDRAGAMSPRVSRVVVTPDKRPDLVCTHVEIPSGVKAGDPVVFQGTLQNVGDGATPRDTVTGLTFYIEGQYTTYATTDGTPLAPGESRIMTANGGRGSNKWMATPGAHTLRVLVDDIDRVPSERRKENNDIDRSLWVDVRATGLLLGAADPAPGQIDLTREGTADWVHWGLNDKADVTRKATGGNQISGWEKIGTGYLDRTPGFGLSARWSDGTPTARVDDTHASLWLNNVGTGYRLSAHADAATRTLRVYVGGIEGARCTLTAHLSDGSAPDYVSHTFNGNAAFDWAPVPGAFTAVYTLRYHAAGPNQRLVVTWTLDGEPNRFLGQARLQAATLALSP